MQGSKGRWWSRTKRYFSSLSILITYAAIRFLTCARVGIDPVGMPSGTHTVNDIGGDFLLSCPHKIQRDWRKIGLPMLTLYAPTLHISF